MASFVKTQDIDILTHQAVSHPATVKGSEQDVSTKISALIALYHASVEAVSNANPGTFLVQVSPSSTGNEDWITIAPLAPSVTTADTEAMTATEPAAETVLAVASTTGFVATDNLYIQDGADVTKGEWAKCEQIVTDTSIDLIDGLTREKAVGDSNVIWNDAEIFYAQLDVSPFARLRVVFQHEGAAGANVHIKGVMSTGDSFA